MTSSRVLGSILAALFLGGCVSGGNTLVSDEAALSAPRVTTHRDGDDLLSAGLGLDGLRNPIAPAVADPDRPTSEELRRRAVHSNWRGIADLASGRGLGSMANAFPNVPGREWSRLVSLPGRRHPHQVLVQVPDTFDALQRCLVVSAASGSRGIYGAIAVAGAWALPKGCAVAYTDKGAGSGLFDVDGGDGARIDGTRAVDGQLDFRPVAVAEAAAEDKDAEDEDAEDKDAEDKDTPHRVAFKHAHSGDNPEADWGRHVLLAAEFGLQALNAAFPDQAPFTAANTRVIAVGISNGGGAVLRAAELDHDGMFDAVVAGAPNIAAPTSGRVLYDYVTEAALFAPCALPAIKEGVAMLPPAARDAVAGLRCTSLHQAGLLTAADAKAQSQEALDHLLAQGWSTEAIALYEQGVAFDLWRAVASAYAQAYTASSVHAPVCGYGYAMLGADGAARASSAAERALWWSDASGIAPTAGIAIVDTLATGPDPAFAGLMCLRQLWLGNGEASQRLRSGIAATRGNARPLSPMVHILHGIDDGLIPIDFSSRPYVAAVRANGIEIKFTEVPDAQHFDAFVGLPTMSRYQPLLPHVYAALDKALAEVLARH